MQQGNRYKMNFPLFNKAQIKINTIALDEADCFVTLNNAYEFCIIWWMAVQPGYSRDGVLSPTNDVYPI